MSSFASAIEHFDDEEFEIAVTSLTKALEETDDNTVRAKILEKYAKMKPKVAFWNTLRSEGPPRKPAAHTVPPAQTARRDHRRATV